MTLEERLQSQLGSLILQIIQLQHEKAGVEDALVRQQAAHEVTVKALNEALEKKPSKAKA